MVLFSILVLPVRISIAFGAMEHQRKKDSKSHPLINPIAQGILALYIILVLILYSIHRPIKAVF